MRRFRYLAVFGVWLVAILLSWMLGGPGFEKSQATGSKPPVQPGAMLPVHPEVTEGHSLFEEGCSTCHGFDAKGLPGRAPSLHGAGAQAADFYLRTGRMPLPNVGDEPRRSQPAYPDAQIEKLVAYISSLGGPAIPEVHPERGDLARGLELFNLTCAGCHATTAAGGVVIGAYAPPLDQSTPTQVAQAVRIGPYLMPRFSKALINDADLDSIARYVQMTQKPEDAGGWGIGHIGPVPEGLVAWLVALAVLLVVARMLGERSEAITPGDPERRN